MVVDNLELHIKSTGEASAKSVNNLSKSLQSLRKSSSTATKHLNTFLGSLKRIAFYRVLRTIIKEIGKAFEEGLKNAYAFSQTINGQLAQTMDRITSLGEQMKNQLGSAFGELLMNLEPIIVAIENVMIRIADALSRLLAVLGGRSTYNKAMETTKKFADASASGAKAAKEWKNQLMGFDEINRLEAPTDTGGGGGSSTDSGMGNWAEAPAQMKWAEELRKVTLDWLAKVNFEPLINSWERLKTAVSGFVAIVDRALYWAYVNVLLPLAQWTIEKGLPTTINLLASAFEFLNAVLEKLKPIFETLWNNVLLPFFTWVGDHFIGALESLTSTFESLTLKIQEANSFKEFLQSLDGKEQLVVSIATAIMAVVGGILALKTVLSIVNLATTAFSLLTSPIGLATIAIAALVYGGIELVKHWDEIKAKAKELGEAIKTWIQDKITAAATAVQEKLEKVKTNVSNFFHDLWDWLYAVFTPLRLVFEFLTSVFQLVIHVLSGINGILSALPGVEAIDAHAQQIQDDGSIWLQGFASGGFPDSGQLFMAREAGPELVGTIGGKTAVVNNSEIINGISGGVRNANEDVVNAIYASASQLVNAMRENSNGGYTDWDAVAHQVTKYQKRHLVSANA